MVLFDEFSANHPDNEKGGWGRLLRRLKPDEADFITTEKYFYDGWLHPQKAKPRVKAIYKIITFESSLNRFHHHKKRVADALGLDAPIGNPSNEHLLFHGTNRACLLGEDKYRVQLCQLSNCHLCNIIRHSFDINKCGTKNKFRRFGNGIYTTAVSSKADDYCRNVEKTSNRVVILNRVIVGHAHRRKYNAVNLSTCPKGFHSVIGDPGKDLNYQETVVYTNDAIRPAYLIVYGEDVDPPETKNKIQTAIRTLFRTPVVS